MTREEAIARVKHQRDWANEVNRTLDVEAFDMATKALEQEPRKGQWEVVSDGYGDNAYICECSECKDTVWVYKDADRKWNYCPNCGADMRVVKE